MPNRKKIISYPTLNWKNHDAPFLSKYSGTEIDWVEKVKIKMGYNSAKKDEHYKDPHNLMQTICQSKRDPGQK